MNFWESLTNWTSSVSSSIFEDRSVLINESNAIGDIFNLNNLTLSFDSIVNFAERLNSGVIESLCSANEIFLVFCQFLQSIAGEVSHLSGSSLL
jgi:hypothetical protein